MAKHFEISIADGELSFKRKAESIARETDLDGIYVIRTSESQQNLSAEDTLRSYKKLAKVEQVFPHTQKYRPAGTAHITS